VSVSAQKAEKIGLVEEVVGRGESLEAALKLAALVDQQSPSSVSRCKRLVMNARQAPQAAGWAAERELVAELFDTQDQKEGVNAFLEKRSANWQNA
jgi:enoyl-CoA hydratase/carnithine racemase